MAFRTVRNYRNEETEPPAPKKHAAVYAPPEKIREIVAVIQVEVPTFAPSEKNIGKIFEFLWSNDAVGGFTLENVRVAVQALSYPTDQLERVVPPPPPLPPLAPAPIEPEEILLPGQISIHASEWELKQPGVTPAQIRDYLKRVREAQ